MGRPFGSWRRAIFGWFIPAYLLGWWAISLHVYIWTIVLIQIVAGICGVIIVDGLFPNWRKKKDGNV